MNTYHDLLDAVKRYKCAACAGIGQCCDLEPGDISGNTWECTECGGTGLSAVVTFTVNPEEKT